MKTIITIITTLILVISCTKEETKPTYQLITLDQILIKCTSSTSGEFYINDSLKSKGTRLNYYKDMTKGDSILVKMCGNNVTVEVFKNSIRQTMNTGSFGCVGVKFVNK